MINIDSVLEEIISRWGIPGLGVGIMDSYIRLANLHLQQGKHAQAEEWLLKASAVNPGSAAVAELLEKALRSQ